MTLAEIFQAEFDVRRGRARLVELFNREYTNRLRYDKSAEIAEARRATELNPTPAQIESGNYPKGKFRLHGLQISLENPKGSIRRGKSREGHEWQVTMAHDYGYIRRHEGADGDHVDVFVGPHPESELVFVVNQVQHDNRKFDEHKVMLGFQTEADAKAGYLANYTQGWKGIGSIVPLTIGQFRKWLAAGDLSQPVSYAPRISVEMFQREFDRRLLVERFQRAFDSRHRYAKEPCRQPKGKPEGGEFASCGTPKRRKRGTGNAGKISIDTANLRLKDFGLKIAGGLPYDMEAKSARYLVENASGQQRSMTAREVGELLDQEPQSKLAQMFAEEFAKRGLGVFDPERYAKDPDFEKKHPRGQPKNAGQFAKKPVTKKDAHRIYRKTITDGGFTFHAQNRRVPTTGSVVSIHQQHEHIVELRDFNAEVVEAYIEDKTEFLKEDPGRHVGSWYDKEANKCYLDVVQVISDPDEAHRLAVENNQEAYYDIERQEVIFVKSADQRRYSKLGWGAVRSLLHRV